MTSTSPSSRSRALPLAAALTLALVAAPGVSHAAPIAPDQAGHPVAESDPTTANTDADPVLAESFLQGDAVAESSPLANIDAVMGAPSALLDPAPAACGMSQAMLDSASATYQSLTSRIDGHGLAPTSLTGTYPAGIMYMRDASAQVIAMLDAGDIAEAAPLMRALVTYPRASGFTRDGASTLPHRLPLISDRLSRREEVGSRVHASSDHQGILMALIPTSDLGPTRQVTRLSLPLRGDYAGPLEVQVIPVGGVADVPSQTGSAAVVLSRTSISAVDVLLSPPGYAPAEAPTSLLVALAPAGTPPEAVDESVAHFLTPEGGSVSAGSAKTSVADDAVESSAEASEVESPQSGGEDSAGLDHPQSGSAETSGDSSKQYATGSTTDAEDPLPSAPDPAHQSLEWMGAKAGRGPAFTSYDFDFTIRDGANGNDNAAQYGHTWEEVDEHYHVIYAWAKYVLAAGSEVGGAGARFASETWPLVSEYVAFHLQRDQYWLNGSPASGATLIKNPRLDASGYHDNVYDLMSNVFLAETYRALGRVSAAIPAVPAVAPLPGEVSWETLASSIDQGIEENLVISSEGKDVYTSWITSDGRPEQVSIWSVLSPLSIDWAGTNPATMRNTLDRYHRDNGFYFGGVEMLNARNGKGQDLNAGNRGYTGQWVLLKSLLWEYKFERQSGNKPRVADLERWAAAYFPPGQTPAPESWIVNNPSQPPVRDGGNQEHSAWFVKSLIDSYPECSEVISAGAHSFNPPLPSGKYVPVDAQRHYGADRIATAADAAQNVYRGTTLQAAYLARSDVFADALSAGTLNDGPILLINANGTLPPATAAALSYLRPQKVVALGGDAVVPANTLDSAAAAARGAQVGRLFGESRFSTSAQIALAAKSPAKDTVYLADGIGADGNGSPDAVSAGGLTDGYLLLVQPGSDRLPKAVRDAIVELGPKKVVALGGPTLVTERALDEARHAAKGASKGRLWGTNRYATSLAIARHGNPYHARNVVVTRGDVLADAITAGGLNLGPILLTPPSGATAPMVYEIKRVRPWSINVLGGPAVVSDRTKNTLALAAVQPG